MLPTANESLSEHALEHQYWPFHATQNCSEHPFLILLQIYTLLQLRACVVIPVYCCPSMLRAAYLIDWEHAWSNQNWFVNARAEQPKMVKKKHTCSFTVYKNSPHNPLHCPKLNKSHFVVLPKKKKKKKNSFRHLHISTSTPYTLF